MVMKFFVFAQLTNNLCNNSHALSWYELKKNRLIKQDPILDFNVSKLYFKVKNFMEGYESSEKEYVEKENRSLSVSQLPVFCSTICFL